MIKSPRKLVVSVVLRDNIGPSKNLFPKCATAVLECSHQINCGVSVDYAKRTKRMACSACRNSLTP